MAGWWLINNFLTSIFPVKADKAFCLPLSVRFHWNLFKHTPGRLHCALKLSHSLLAYGASPFSPPIFDFMQKHNTRHWSLSARHWSLSAKCQDPIYYSQKLHRTRVSVPIYIQMRVRVKETKQVAQVHGRAEIWTQISVPKCHDCIFIYLFFC